MDIVNFKKLHFFEQNVKTPEYEFYKVNWTSPFNEKYKRYVEPGLTAINKKYIKISYNKKLYLVSIKTYKKLCEISNPINFYVTNTNEYISRNNLEKIKAKTLTTNQLTTLYLYQSQFYYDYWAEMEAEMEAEAEEEEERAEMEKEEEEERAKRAEMEKEAAERAKQRAERRRKNRADRYQ